MLATAEKNGNGQRYRGGSLPGRLANFDKLSIGEKAVHLSRQKLHKCTKQTLDYHCVLRCPGGQIKPGMGYRMVSRKKPAHDTCIAREKAKYEAERAHIKRDEKVIDDYRNSSRSPVSFRDRILGKLKANADEGLLKNHIGKLFSANKRAEAYNCLSTLVESGEVNVIQRGPLKYYVPTYKVNVPDEKEAMVDNTPEPKQEQPAPAEQPTNDNELEALRAELIELKGWKAGVMYALEQMKKTP